MLRKVSDDATKEGYILIKYIVQGGTKLSGSVTISGAKNAAVAILPATLLVSGPCRIENVPDISDVRLLLEILRDMGAEIHRYGRNTLEIDCSRARNATAPIELVRRIRASYYLIGAELGRFGHAHVAMPGGCNFGVRPIDQHIKGFEAMGAMVEQSGGYVCADAPKGGLRGGHVYLDIVSVGATMNILLAAVLCSGMTIIENCAKEPHIVDLANFLNAMGAQVSGAGTDVIKVRGVRALHGGSYSIIPDQIEAGTYMAAAAAVGGDVLIENVIPKHLDCITAKLVEMGVERPDLHVTADPVFNLDPAPKERAGELLRSAGLERGTPFAAVSVRDWPDTGSFAGELAALCDHLYRTCGMEILFLMMQPCRDRAATAQVRSAMECPSHLLDAPCTPRELMAVLGEGRLCLAMRLHTLIFSARMAVPVLGLVYDPKVASYLKELDLPAAGRVDSFDAQEAGRRPSPPRTA